jgi:membrane associated rhomboid family serine protease
MFNQSIPNVTKNLLIINGLFFLATYIFGSRGIDLYPYLGAFYPESVNFQSWQIITHMFMHGGFSHILFNMFALWMFGSTVEYTLGPKKFLILYFAAGLGSYVLYNFTNYLQIENLKTVVEATGVNVPEFIQSLTYNTSGSYMLPSSTDMESVKELARYYVTPMVGASGAIYGVLVAFGVLYPNAKLALLFFPVPVKAKFFIPIMIALEFFLAIQDYAWNPVAHFAHIGGAIIGFILVRAWKKKINRDW